MKKTLIITFLLTLTSCQTMQSVDRGLYSATNSVSSQDRITGARTLNIADRPKQIAQGNKAVEQILAQYKKEGKPIDAELDSIQFNRAKRIFSRIQRVSHMADEQWTLHLIPDDSFNAFTTGGTTIVVHEGLMKKLKSDDEVASVLGHELAHVSANHVFERQGSQIANMVGGSKVAKSGLVQAAYSRQDESEADRIGILYAALAGYDPHAASGIWSDIYQSSGDNGQMVNNHPLSSQRMSDAEAVADKVEQYYRPGLINASAQDILNSNALYQKRGQAAAPGQGGGIASLLETAANFYVQKQQAKQGAAQESQRILMLREIQNNLKLVDSGTADNGSIGMRFAYLGQRPVGNLVVKAVSQSGASVYQVRNVVNPNTEFSAFFSPEIIDQQKYGLHQKIQILVDEGEYLR